MCFYDCLYHYYCTLSEMTRIKMINRKKYILYCHSGNKPLIRRTLCTIATWYDYWNVCQGRTRFFVSCVCSIQKATRHLVARSRGLPRRLVITMKIITVIVIITTTITITITILIILILIILIILIMILLLLLLLLLLSEQNCSGGACYISEQ